MAAPKEVDVSLDVLLEVFGTALTTTQTVLITVFGLAAAAVAKLGLIKRFS